MSALLSSSAEVIRKPNKRRRPIRDVREGFGEGYTMYGLETRRSCVLWETIAIRSYGHCRLMKSLTVRISGHDTFVQARRLSGPFSTHSLFSHYQHLVFAKKRFVVLHIAALMAYVCVDTLCKSHLVKPSVAPFLLQIHSQL